MKKLNIIRDCALIAFSIKETNHMEINLKRITTRIVNTQKLTSQIIKASKNNLIFGIFKQTPTIKLGINQAKRTQFNAEESLNNFYNLKYDKPLFAQKRADIVGVHTAGMPAYAKNTKKLQGEFWLNFGNKKSRLADCR